MRQEYCEVIGTRRFYQRKEKADASVDAHIIEAAGGIRQNYDIFWREQTTVGAIHSRLLLDCNDLTRSGIVVVWQRYWSPVQRHVLAFGPSVSRTRSKIKHTSGSSQKMVAVIVGSPSVGSSLRSPGSSDNRSTIISCSGSRVVPCGSIISDPSVCASSGASSGVSTAIVVGLSQTSEI